MGLLFTFFYFKKFNLFIKQIIFMKNPYDLFDRKEVPKMNPRLKYLKLHYFAMRLPLGKVLVQLRNILGNNLLEYCMSSQHGSIDCLIVLKTRINQQSTSFLNIHGDGSAVYTPKVYRVLNKNRCIASIRTKDWLSNMATKKETDPTIYLQVDSMNDMQNVDTIIEALNPEQRPDVILALNYPGSNINSVKSQLKAKSKIVDEIDPTIEMLSVVPPMPGFDREWIEDRDSVSRDHFSEQLFALEKSLETIQTQEIDFFFYNLDSFGVHIVGKKIPMERMKKLIEEFKRKMHIFLDKILLKNIIPLGPVISITAQMFPIFLSQAGSGFKRVKKVKAIQLHFMYILLYFSDFKITEIINLKKSDLLDLMEKGSTEILFADFNSDINRLSKKLSEMKKKLPNLVSYPMKGNEILSEKLKEKQKEIDILFDTYGFSCLGSNPQRSKGLRSLGDEKLWLGIISVDLMHTASVLGLSGKFSASSLKKKKHK